MGVSIVDLPFLQDLLKDKVKAAKKLVTRLRCRGKKVKSIRLKRNDVKKNYFDGG